MNKIYKAALGASALLVSLQAGAQVMLYEGENFRGPVYNTGGQVNDLSRIGFNDRASSVIVERGRWEVCEHARFEGTCVMLRPGSYDSLSRLGLNNQISSIRPARNVRYDYTPEPLAQPSYNYRRRPNERLYEAPVTSVKAVVNGPERRCWTEREEVRGDGNVGGAVVGAILGGVLGHQIGSGRGNDAATALGAVGGGALGYNYGRDGGTRDVQRCENVATGPVQYYDVTYQFQNREHHAQVSEHPGRTLTVNQRGEPRG